ncbi:MAG: LuxR C-terminal-related transcriptional regulator [Vicinamibacterales bacterium]
MKAVRRVGAGKPYVSEETSERILTSLGSTRRPEPEGTPLDRLSDRERHVLALIGQGLATREIAAQLQVSVKTVERHYAHIKESAARRARQQRRDQCGREPDGGGRREA